MGAFKNFQTDGNFLTVAEAATFIMHYSRQIWKRFHHTHLY